MHDQESFSFRKTKNMPIGSLKTKRPQTRPPTLHSTHCDDFATPWKRTSEPTMISIRLLRLFFLLPWMIQDVHSNSAEGTCEDYDIELGENLGSTCEGATMIHLFCLASYVAICHIDFLPRFFQHHCISLTSSFCKM